MTARSAARKPAGRAHAQRASASLHALVANADVGTTKLCRDELMRQGMTVDVADTGVAALALARQRQPDVIFIDLQLSDAPGHEVIAWLQAIPALKTVPIIALSAVDEDLSRLHSTGTQILLTKPLSAPMIVDALRRHRLADLRPVVREPGGRARRGAREHAARSSRS